MTIFYYTDHSQKGDPFIFVIETNSALTANAAFKEQLGADYYKQAEAGCITCEPVFDQILEIPGEERERLEIKRCKHNQDLRYACGACRNEKEKVPCRHGTPVGQECKECVIILKERDQALDELVKEAQLLGFYGKPKV